MSGIRRGTLLEMEECMMGDIAIERGISREDWYGDSMADKKAKEGAEQHGYTLREKRAISDNVQLVER
eukprot:905728-Heterocapsa_arctica.AAC.1